MKRRTGVGLGGVVLYVFLLAAGVAVAGTLGHLEVYRGGPLEYVAGLLYAVGLLGVVAAVGNLPEAIRLWRGGESPTGAGTLALTGTIEATNGTVDSPFLERAAVCYSYRVLGNDVDDDPDPDGESNWSLVATGEDGTAFALRADSGDRVRVDPDGATLHLADAEEVSVGPGEDPPAAVTSFHQETGIAPPAADEGRRYEERVLGPDEEVFVGGSLASTGTPEVADDGWFVVADADYPGRVRSRVTLGLLLGVPVALFGFLSLLYTTDVI